MPDPTDAATFQASRLADETAWSESQRLLRRFYQQLLQLRQSHPALSGLDKKRLLVEVDEAAATLVCHRRHPQANACILAHFGDQPRSWSGWWPTGVWQRQLDSADHSAGGHGSELPDRLEIADDRVDGLALQPFQFVVWIN